MSHIADIWNACDELTRDMAKRFPAATFTCVRDIYGRCSFATEGLKDEEFAVITAKIGARQDIQPYLGSMGVKALGDVDPLGAMVRQLRAPLGDLPNAFVVERLLSNESWLRPADHNPKEWPPVVAFYSFKGGVGRTTTTALTALTLAREGKRVIVIDLDLEAPGIEGYFFRPDDEAGKSRAGVVDFILELALFGEEHPWDMNDFVLPYSDPAISASGGSLFVVSAGKLDETYMERLGRVNLADIGRKQGQDNPLRALIRRLLAWGSADVVLVDCRTGFTDLGGITLNGLSALDVLVFRAGETDRRYLPVVLRHIQRFRTIPVRTPEVAEQLAKSFVIVYTMVDTPAKPDEAEQYIAELRSYTSRECWKHVFEQFSESGYTYPSADASDSPMEPVPHDVVLIPYLREFSMLSSVSDMLRLQGERPERPYDVLVRRLVDVKLPPASKDGTARSTPPPAADSPRKEALGAISTLAGSVGAEREFDTADDVRRRFLPRAAYRTLLDPKAYLVLGRKGTGKSALFQILTKDAAAQALLSHLDLDPQLASKTRWEVGFSADNPDSPERGDFVRLLEKTRDRDRLTDLWRFLAAFRIARVIGKPIPNLETPSDCIDKLSDQKAQSVVQSFLSSCDRSLAGDGRFLSLSYDDLDVGLPLDVEKRGLLVSALVEYWQQAVRRLPRIRAKIFLREDIWNREVEFDDKSKVRDGIDRGTITWDGIDIYRTVLKRLGHDAAVRRLLTEEGLWRSDFDAMMEKPLGFIPPADEDWVRRCVHVLAGETMAKGPAGHKKGYVYTWVLNHIADSAGLLRPRNALLLFAESAKLQEEPEPEGALLNPWRFMDALRGAVSGQAVDDLRAEYKKEWSVDKTWIPDQFSSFQRVWPVSEEDLSYFLKKELKRPIAEIREKIEHMRDAGLLQRRVLKGRDPELQVPDIYLFGLGLTRKG